MQPVPPARRALKYGCLAALISFGLSATPALGQALRDAVPLTMLDGNQPPVLPDLHPSWRIVEVDIEAVVTQKEYTPGVFTDVYAFEGVVPGPTISAHVGQTLIVNFTNSLPEATSIHWHGVEVPANMDGSNIAQTEVPPGGQFRYVFKLIREGHFWYHPHFHTNQQIERGMHGSLLIRNAFNDWRIDIPGWNQYLLTVDDVKLDATGQLAPFASNLTNGMDPVDRAEELLNGRTGDLFITNGTHMPTIDVVENRPILLRVVAPTNGRFMRLNLPGHSLIQISSDGALLNEMVVKEEMDYVPDHHGMGSVSNPDPAKGMLLSPSERADLVIIPRGDPGDELFLEWHDFPTGRHITFPNGGGVGIGHAHDDGERPHLPIARLRFRHGRGNGWNPYLPLTGSFPTVPIPIDADTEQLSVFFGHGPPADDGSIMFFSAVKMSDELQAALDGKLAEAEDPENVGPIAGLVMPPPFEPQAFPVLTVEDALHAQVGDVKIWEVTSFTGGAHTFHTHGFPFQPLEMILVNLDGNSPEERVQRTALPLATKDNIMMPGRPGQQLGRSWTILRAAVRFDDSDRPLFLQRTPEQLVAHGKVPVTDDPLNPDEGTSGGWLVHCHILEHASRGMLTFLNLVLP